MSLKQVTGSLIPSLLCLFMFAGPMNAQEVQIDEDGFEIFTYQEGDTSYTMKKYFMAFLKKGPNRSQNEKEAMEIQAAHLEHMSHLAEQKKICIAGPFGDDTDLRGIVIYSARSMEEARSFADSDPAVIKGVLIAEIHPWWAAKGSTLD